MDGSRPKRMSEHGSSTNLASIMPTKSVLWPDQVQISHLFLLLKAGQKRTRLYETLNVLNEPVN